MEQKVTKQIQNQNNNNINDITMFNSLIEQVSQIASDLQELKAQVSHQHSWQSPQASLPMMQNPVPYPPQPFPLRPFAPEPFIAQTTVGTDNLLPVAEPTSEDFTKIPPKDPVKHNTSEEILEELNIKALETLSKYHKQGKNLSIIIAMLQYFLVSNCKQKFHSNWTNKKDYTRAELLLALTTNPTVFGSEFESAIQSAWIKHLKDNQESYTRALSILNINIMVIMNSDDSVDAKNYIGKLTNYLNSPKNIIFTKKVS